MSSSSSLFSNFQTLVKNIHTLPRTIRSMTLFMANQETLGKAAVVKREDGFYVTLDGALIVGLEPSDDSYSNSSPFITKDRYLGKGVTPVEALEGFWDLLTSPFVNSFKFSHMPDLVEWDVDSRRFVPLKVDNPETFVTS